MVRLCFFNTAKAWGGGEKWHFEVSKHLHNHGHRVMVIAHKESVLYQKLVQAEIPCHGVKLTNISFINPFKYVEIIKLLRKGNYQAIIMNLSRDVKVAGICARRVNIGRIIYRRGSAIPIKDSFFNRFLFRKIITEVLANSEATKKTVLENNARLFPGEKITVIHNGIEIPEAHITGSRDKIEEIVLLNLGRLEFQKNQKFLVHLGAELKKRDLQFRILIGGEGKLRKELEDLISKFQLQEHVFLKGFIEDPIKFIAQADIFILPSLWEGFGYVLAEAALCSKPIIAFDVSSNPELVLHQKTGFLVPVNDVQCVADRIMELYRDPARLTEMGLAGYSHIKKNFDKKIQLQKIEDYLLNG